MTVVEFAGLGTRVVVGGITGDGGGGNKLVSVPMTTMGGALDETVKFG
jgi:hypothetical protein